MKKDIYKSLTPAQIIQINDTQIDQIRSAYQN